MLETDHPVLVQQVDHVLRHVWDPIELGVEGPVDEYDSYVPSLVALVRDARVHESEIIAHLVRIETKAMGLAPPLARATRAARAFLGLREACGRAPDLLFTQTVSHDGLRCLWVFRRPDALFAYEHATFRQETDVNGTWSWWDAAGEGRSGLFATAEAAMQDARASIAWLR